MSTGLELVDVEGRHPSDEETNVEPDGQVEQVEEPPKE